MEKGGTIKNQIWAWPTLGIHNLGKKIKKPNNWLENDVSFFPESCLLGSSEVSKSRSRKFLLLSTGGYYENTKMGCHRVDIELPMIKKTWSAQIALRYVQQFVEEDDKFPSRKVTFFYNDSFRPRVIKSEFSEQLIIMWLIAYFSGGIYMVYAWN